jgi:Fe-S cluster assembly ATPase SufC
VARRQRLHANTTTTGALAEDPKLLLLDELTTFLDVEDQFGVLQAVKAITHQRRDVTAVWVTHRCVLGAGAVRGARPGSSHGTWPTTPDHAPPPHTHTQTRFEELAYADAASYMEDGRVVFTGSPEQMTARLRAMGASIA